MATQIISTKAVANVAKSAATGNQSDVKTQAAAALANLTGRPNAKDKAHATALYVAHFKAEPRKGYTTKDMLSRIVNNIPHVNGRNTTKAQARAEFVAKFGFDAPKSYTEERIRDTVASNVAPKVVGRGGLTADKCRKLISAGIALGIVPKAEATGRSAWKAAQLREFVAKFKLETRISVAAE